MVTARLVRWARLGASWMTASLENPTGIGGGGRLPHPLVLARSAPQVLFDKPLDSVPTQLQVSLRTRISHNTPFSN